MKTTFKLGSLEVQGVKLNDIEVTQEYTALEAVQLVNAGKKFVQDLIKELPEMLEGLEVAFNKFNEIDERVEREEAEKAKEMQTQMPEDLKALIKEVNERNISPFKIVSVRRG